VGVGIGIIGIWCWCRWVNLVLVTVSSYKCISKKLTFGSGGGCTIPCCSLLLSLHIVGGAVFEVIGMVVVMSWPLPLAWAIALVLAWVC
jgi:hypothetical protein